MLFIIIIVIITNFGSATRIRSSIGSSNELKKSSGKHDYELNLQLRTRYNLLFEVLSNKKLITSFKVLFCLYSHPD